jgi:hypothetical protein
MVRDLWQGIDGENQREDSLPAHERVRMHWQEIRHSSERVSEGETGRVTRTRSAPLDRRFL